MTHAQLDHLRRIDAHLASLLAIAEKRTPGEWVEGNRAVWHDCNNESQNEVCEFVSPQNAAFIASCAGNAEAGWKATRAVIKSYYDSSICREWQGYMQSAIEPILSAFPNI